VLGPQAKRHTADDDRHSSAQSQTHFQEVVSRLVSLGSGLGTGGVSHSRIRRRDAVQDAALLPLDPCAVAVRHALVDVVVLAEGPATASAGATDRERARW